MSVDEQYLTKELIKLQEQTQKMMNSEIMQDAIKRDKAMLEQMKKSGLFAQMEQIKKQIVAVAPETPNLQVYDNHSLEQIKKDQAPEPDLIEQIKDANEKAKRLLRKLYDEGGCDFDALWEFSDEYRYRWREGAYNSWTEALEDGKKKSLVKGQIITQSIKDLQAEYHKKHDRNKDALKTPLIESK